MPFISEVEWWTKKGLRQVLYTSFSALILMDGWQEEHPVDIEPSSPQSFSTQTSEWFKEKPANIGSSWKMATKRQVVVELVEQHRESHLKNLWITQSHSAITRWQRFVFYTFNHLQVNINISMVIIYESSSFAASSLQLSIKKFLSFPQLLQIETVS